MATAALFSLGPPLLRSGPSSCWMGPTIVTIDSLNVDATVGGTSTATYGWGIQLVNNADNNIIQRCVVTTSTTSTSTFFAGIVASGSTTSATTGGATANQNLTLDGNTVTGGYYGITVLGNTTASPNPGYILRNNRVRDFYFYGVYSLYLSGPQFIGNDVARPTRTSVSTYYGIYLGTGVSGARVEKNRLHQAFSGAATSTSAAYGIYFTTGTAATATTPNDVINNLIYDVDGNGTVYGIYNTGSSYIRLYHNTISIDDQTNTSTNATYGYYHTTGVGVEFKNNIVRITRAGGGAKYPLFFTSATGANIVSDYNDLTGSGTNFNTGSYLGTDYATLAAWRTANGGVYDPNSVDADPQFVSPPNNLRPTTAALNNVAQPLARVTDDITGAARSATPDIGAYEFTPSPNDVAVVSLASPVSPVAAGARTVSVVIRNNGTTPLTSVTLSYTLNGGTAVTNTLTVSSLASGASTTVSFATPATLVAGLNTFVVTATLPNGQPDPTPANNTITTTVYTALAGGAYTINNVLPTGGTNFAQLYRCGQRPQHGGITGAGHSHRAQRPLHRAVFAGRNQPVLQRHQYLVVNGGGRTIRFASTNSHQRAVVQLNGTDYTTINNLNIDATNNGAPGTYGYGVLLTNAADNDRITNCTINADIATTSTNFVGIAVSGSTSSATTSGNSANSLTLEGNTVNGGYYGITLYGNTTALNTGNIVRNNTVRDFYFYGIYAGYQDGPQFIGNDISRPLRTNSSTFYGIYLFGNSRGAAIEKNRIHNTFDGSPTSTSAVYGIYLATGTGATATTTNDVVNNALYNLSGNGLQYLIYNLGAAYSRIYNNTITSDDQTATTASVTYGIYNSGANVDVRNNSVSITRTGTGTKYGLYYATAATTSNYNNLYVPGGNVGYSTTAYATLAAWQAAAAGFDANSVSADPNFVSAATGNLQPANVALNNAGTPLARVTEDITGAARGAAARHRGLRVYPGSHRRGPGCAGRPGRRRLLLRLGRARAGADSQRGYRSAELGHQPGHGHGSGNAAHRRSSNLHGHGEHGHAGQRRHAERDAARHAEHDGAGRLFLRRDGHGRGRPQHQQQHAGARSHPHGGGPDGRRALAGQHLHLRERPGQPEPGRGSQRQPPVPEQRQRHGSLHRHYRRYGGDLHHAGAHQHHLLPGAR